LKKLLEKLEAKLPKKIAVVITEIRENEKDPEKMKLIEYISFALGQLCYGSIRHLASGYRQQFYMAAGLEPLRAGQLVFSQTVFDAVSDPTVASYIDKRKDISKGRFMPFLPRLVPIMATLSIVMFTSPTFLQNPWAVFAWLFMTYAIWEVVNTLSGVSFDAIGTVMSADQRERTLYTTIGNLGFQLAGMIPGFIPALLEVLAIEREGREPLVSQATFFTICAIVFAIIGIASGLFTKNLKERITQERKDERFLDNFRLFWQNKSLLLLWTTNIPQLISSAAGPTSAQFYIHAVGNAAWQSVQWTVAGIPHFLAHTLAPFFINRFRPSRIIIVCTMANGVSFTLLFLIGRIVGYDTWLGILNIMIFASIGWIPAGIAGIARRLLQINTFDYTAAQTGKRAEATSLALFALGEKLLWALAALLGGYALQRIGFIQDIGGVQQLQSQETRDGLFFIFALFPAIGNLLGALPMFFFKLEGPEFERRMAELHARNAEQAEAIEEIEQDAPV